MVIILKWYLMLENDVVSSCWIKYTLMFKYWVCLCLDVCSLKVLTRHAVRRACSSSPNFLPITISAGEASQITSLQVPNPQELSTTVEELLCILFQTTIAQSGFISFTPI